MFRRISRLRRLAALVATVLAIAVVAATLSVRNTIRDDQSVAKQRWVAARPLLDARYQKLVALQGALKNAGGGDRDAVRGMDAPLSKWSELRTAPAAVVDAAAEVAAANELEGLAQRTIADVKSSARLQANSTVVAAIQAYESTPPPQDELNAFNRAAAAYKASLDGPASRLLADWLDFEAWPTFQSPILGTTGSDTTAPDSTESTTT